ncbi:ribonuclease J [bacterium (Candidatus Gribaldobacteria) CG10_big_fil_rev_8_21_14_0_10_41_12]|uniref:Ribonuclease J n=1 Tax=bacterium (Candidatus Gribaldobacteria) CG10_big_fil_rev_8_21_14_0_10_41_12 TaxID=2014277 RepID=A0A2H0UXU1_9BACT|nr:MAG: ribonuclease J [bacterium (Candidatus Gribaldobacteria) CG10_big_fil_rev_8_21_14_0_10_41_12]
MSIPTETNNLTRPKQPRTTRKTTAAPHLRIIPLGGMEEVGRNMTVFEYEKDIVILDMGIQFPEEDMPGIDYIIPSISYLKGKEKNIRAVIFTHGHLDHIGAVPLLLPKLGFPPVMGRDLTIAMIKKRMEDFERNSAKRLDIIKINSVNDRFNLGNFRIGFFNVEHSIVDAVGVIIGTPQGTIIHPGDWTMEKDPTSGHPLTYNHLANLPRPKILMLESLGATNTSPEMVSEKKMYANLEKLISEAKGKVIIGTFASQIKRIGYLLEYAKQIGKKVALDGYSMKINVEIARELGYIKTNKETIISVNDVSKYPDDKIIVICTGAQGEGNAVLSRIVSDSHKFIKIRKNDTIIFSSSVIPGNERTIQRLKDNLYRKCDNVIHSDIMDVHASGHCNADSIKEIIKQIQPDFFLPVYANHYILKETAKLALEAGVNKDKIFVLDNGSIIEFGNKTAKLSNKKAETGYVFVDGLGVGDVGEVVLRDRQNLSQDGMFVIVVVIDRQTGKAKGSPDIISRGFVYLRESKDLLRETRKKVIDIVNQSASVNTINGTFVKDEIRNKIGDFLFFKTERRPMVLPVVIEV